MPEHTTIPHRQVISRRGLLTAAGAVGAGGLLAGCGAPEAEASSAPARSSLDLGSGLNIRSDVETVRERALNQTGKRRAGSEWEQLAPDGDWNFAFLTWLLEPGASHVPGKVENLRAEAESAGVLESSPRKGAVLIRTSQETGEGTDVEFVTDVTDRAVFTVAGDIARPIPPDQSFVRRFCYPPDAELTYYYPTYSS